MTKKEIISILNQCESLDEFKDKIEKLSWSDERKAKGRLEYDSGHLYVSIRDISKVGHEYNYRIVASGLYTEDGIALNIDAYAYIIMVDDTTGGVFFRSYPKYSQHTASSYLRNPDADVFKSIKLIADTSFSDLLCKVKSCKEFKEAKAKRVIDCISMAKAAAVRVNNDKVRHAERLEAKTMKVDK